MSKHNIDFEYIGKGWIKEYINIPYGNNKERKFWDILDKISIEEPLSAIYIIETIANLCDDDWVFSNVGSGPLENILNESLDLVSEYTLKLIDENANFRKIMKHVWKGDIDDSFWGSVQNKLDKLR